jgi:hypothetical protein
LREPAVKRFAILAALVGCKTRVIDLNRPDAALDAHVVGCACRIPCTSTTIDACVILGTGTMCGSDHFCAGSLGACTLTTPSPCGGSDAPTSVCRDVSSPNVCE